MKDFRYPDSWPFNFGEYLRSLREGKGLSQSDAAELSDGKLNPSAISVIERHLIASTPSMRHLEGLAKVYDLPVLYLFALAYISEKGLDPATVDRVWQTFDLERFGDTDRGPTEALVPIPRQQLEQLGPGYKQLRIYSLRNVGLLSYEVTHQGFVLDTDIIGVDRECEPLAGNLVAGWWREEKKLLIYRYIYDERDVVIPAQRKGEPYQTLASVSNLETLGVVVWRSGVMPK